jgi:hypothetical protein
VIWRCNRNLILAVGLTLAGSGAWAQGEGNTLRQVLAAEKLPVDADALPNLDKTITSGAELNDAGEFAIAYYLNDTTGQLNPPIYIDLYDRQTKRWRSGSIGRTTGKAEGVDDECYGAVLSITAISDYYALETHNNPSAGCELILTRDLKLKTSLYGWIIGHFGDGGIVYERSQVHFATVHPAEIAMYDPGTGKDYTIFPHKPFQDVRLKIIKELGEFFKTHQEYCQKANDPCDPEKFDSSVEDKVVTDDREHALAFVISYELQGYGQADDKPDGPTHVVYVYRHVNDEAKMEYREMLWSEVKARAGDVPLERLVEPPMIEKIFAEAGKASANKDSGQHSGKLR